MSIRIKLIMMLLLFSMIPLGILGTVAIVKSQQAMEKQVGEHSLAFAKLFTSRIQEFLYEKISDSKIWSQDSRLVKASEGKNIDQASRYLKNVVDFYGDYFYAVCLNPKGIVIASSDPSLLNKQCPSLEIFRKTLDGANHIRDVHIDPWIKKGVLTFFSPIKRRDHKSSKGVLMVALKWKHLTDKITNWPISGSPQSLQNHIMVTNKDGLSIVGEHDEELFEFNLLEFGMASAKLASQHKEGYLLERTEHGYMSFSAYTYFKPFKDMPHLNWNLIMLQEPGRIFSGLELLKKTILWMLLLVMFLISFVSFFLARKISQPILNIASKAKAIGKGDFSQRTEVVSSDEIGILSMAFNNMVENVQSSSENLRKANLFTESILNSMIDGVIVVTLNGQIERINQASLDLSGYSQEELEQKEIASLFVKEPNIHEMLEQNTINMENELILQNGKKLPVMCTISPMGTNLLVCVIRDLTDLKEGEEKQERLEAQLRHSQKLQTIGTLAGGIAHDFNNILTPIHGYTEIALRQLDPKEKLYSHMKNILKLSERAQKLVQQILIFSRQAEKEKVVVHINHIVHESYLLLKEMFPSNIEIHKKIEEGISYTVLADPTQIHQIMMNLSTNASHAMEGKNGCICISLDLIELPNKKMNKISPDLVPGKYIKLEIADTGHGMDQKTIERIFEPFFTTKDVGKGTGLGLSMVHGIITGYNGDIVVNSVIGEGTTFSIYLPQYTEQIIQKEVVVVKEVTSSGKEHVLFVDDEEKIASMVNDLLGYFDYEVTTSTKSLEALELFRQNPNQYDIVVTDQTMPDLVGFEFAQKLHEIRADLPIIIVSGYSTTLDLNKLEEVGIQAYVEKPFSMKNLSATIRQVLDDQKKKDSS